MAHTLWLFRVHIDLDRDLDLVPPVYYLPILVLRWQDRRATQPNNRTPCTSRTWNSPLI